MDELKDDKEKGDHSLFDQVTKPMEHLRDQMLQMRNVPYLQQEIMLA